MEDRSVTVTLHEIARESGVSAQTASRILRGQVSRHNPETCERVRRVAMKLDYRPNFLSRALLGGKSMSIGLLTQGMGVSVSMARAHSATRQAREQGYLVYLVTQERRRDEVKELTAAIQDLIDRRVDGLIVQRSRPVPAAVGRFIQRLSVPVVFLDWGPPAWPAKVVIDRESAIEKLAAHLGSLGHRRAAFFANDYTVDYTENKIGPYERAFARQGIELRIEQIRLPDTPEVRLEMGDIEQRTYDTVAQFLRRDTGATALLMNNDEGAHSALAAARDQGRRVPTDVSIVGFDDLPLARYTAPALTTIRNRAADEGAAAYAMLHKLMQNPDAAVEPTVCPLELVQRGSTGPAPRGAG